MLLKVIRFFFQRKSWNYLCCNSYYIYETLILNVSSNIYTSCIFFFLPKLVGSLRPLIIPYSEVVWECRVKCFGPEFCLWCVVYVKESTYRKHLNF